ncbi:MAG: hypothetical protein A3F10_01735 [Coxiella sp. RIFCSPHIGHO2_12_FULL_42_15]|nr:MAG: hypothetical protein A3F10_01735 [Coxiella sp. RIFCSPHIGHO2_12_FULL_42_15]
MPFFKSGSDHREIIFFIPGINGTATPGLEAFIETLVDQISNDKVIYTYTDDRLINGNVTMPRDLAEMARTIVNDIRETAPGKSEYNIIFYSYSCLSAPYVKKYMDDLGITLRLTLIDQPALSIIRNKKFPFKVKMISEILLRVAVNLEIDTQPLTPENQAILSQYAREKKSISHPEVINKIFNCVIPDFNAQIQKMELSFQDNEAQNDPEYRDILREKLFRAHHILILTRTNIKEMFSAKMDLSKTALLKNTLIISTVATLNYHKCLNTDLGWSFFLDPSDASNQMNCLRSESANHFSIMNPTSLKGGDCEALQYMISAWHKLYAPSSKITFPSGATLLQQPSTYFSIQPYPSRKREYSELQITPPSISNPLEGEFNKRKKMDFAIQNLLHVFDLPCSEKIKDEMASKIAISLFAKKVQLELESGREGNSSLSYSRFFQWPVEPQFSDNEAVPFSSSNFP